MDRSNLIKYLFILNIIIFFNNFLFYLTNLNKEKIVKFNYKNSDNFLINICIKSYKAISHEIFKKINILKQISFIKKFLSTLKLKNKKTIILYFEDNNNRTFKPLIEQLEKRYIIKESPENPDYLIYNVFGCNHLKEKYNNSIKIAIFTENQIPDFNIADYAISQHHIHYLDRYFKFPFFFYKILSEIKNFAHIGIKNQINNTKKKFCAAVITNNRITDYFRLNFINELNKYKRVDMGGRYNNNVGEIRNKIEFLSSYKFSIAMENTEGDGYASEKIIESFLSGTIPIYYGDYMIDEYINPKSFILIRGEKDMIEKIDYIKKIDNNDELYKNILNEKILVDPNISNHIIKEYYEFLSHIFEQDKNNAKRINKIKTF